MCRASSRSGIEAAVGWTSSWEGRSLSPGWTSPPQPRALRTASTRSVCKKRARRSQGPCGRRRRGVCAKKGPAAAKGLADGVDEECVQKGAAAAKGLADGVDEECVQKRARRSQGPCGRRRRGVCAKKGPPQLVGLRRAGRNRALWPWVVARAMGECLRGRPHLLGSNPLRGSDATVPCLSDQCSEDPFFADRLVSLGQLPPSLSAGRRRSEAPSMVDGGRNDRPPVFGQLQPWLAPQLKHR